MPSGVCAPARAVTLTQFRFCASVAGQRCDAERAGLILDRTRQGRAQRLRLAADLQRVVGFYAGILFAQYQEHIADAADGGLEEKIKAGVVLALRLAEWQEKRVLVGLKKQAIVIAAAARLDDKKLVHRGAKGACATHVIGNQRRHGEGGGAGTERKRQ